MKPSLLKEISIVSSVAIASHVYCIISDTATVQQFLCTPQKCLELLALYVNVYSNVEDLLLCLM